MTFVPKKTNDRSVSTARKVLLVAHHGFGKTTQAKHYAQHYGKGFIISGEGGLQSIMDEEIDYLHFSSWDGKHEPENDVYSFRGIIKMVMSPEFKAQGYKWIMLDSLTEASDLAFAHFEKIEMAKAKPNKWDIYSDYASAIIGACKFIRDLPMHVIVTALAKEEKDDNGEVHYWPMIQGQKAQKQIPGIFDNVLCGVRHTSYDDGDTERRRPKVSRFIITDEVKGWHGKIRTPFPERFRSVEPTGNVIELLMRMDMSPHEWAQFQALQAQARAQREAEVQAAEQATETQQP